MLKPHLKLLVKSLLGGVFSLFGKLYTKNKLTVFCYHDVSHNPSEFSRQYNLNVPPDIFEYQINFICKNFNVISTDDLLDGKFQDNSALITFDDGFKSYFKTAVPILNNYKLPSTIFLNMAPVKNEIFWSGLTTYLCDKSPEFCQLLKKNTECHLKEKPMYLYCTREIVNSFLKFKGKTFKEEVDKFVGEFASQEDLSSVSSNRLVTFGNHLYNHDVAMLISKSELLESYNKNEHELKKYPNSKSIFAFPYGQPDTCFSYQQIELLIDNGAQLVFSAVPVINSNASALYLHRIPLHSFNNSKFRIWFVILFYTLLKKYMDLKRKYLK